MELNPLPEDFEGEQKRQTEFDSDEEKLTYDAKGLIEKARIQSKRLGQPVDPITLARRADDNMEALQAAIDKEQGAVRPAVDAVMASTDALVTDSAELSPEQVWLNQFKVRFDDPALKKLHEGIQWTDIENSLKADPEAMRKLQALDEKGHAMNVFGEENGEFIFASAWDNYSKVSADHRNITYDLEGQILAESLGYTPTGNAVSIIAAIMGVKEDEAERYLADPALHEQLRKVIGVNGFAWLKTDAATRKTGRAFHGDGRGCYRYYANNYFGYGSFRAALRVKRA